MTKFRPVCYQSPKQAYVASESEDCLHLTVWQPLAVAQNASAAADVIVFFHGGDLTFGSANFYNMSLLATDGNIVVVAVNYRWVRRRTSEIDFAHASLSRLATRLNLFGFLATRELTTFDGRNSSGNFGLLDMQESLRWVQRNIKHVSAVALTHCIVYMP